MSEMNLQLGGNLPKTLESANEAISRNDYQIVEFLLYPDKPPHKLYHSLIGEVSRQDRRPWPPEDQVKAQAGIRRLFEVELEPFQLISPGVEGARNGLVELMFMPEGQRALAGLAAQGRDLAYQRGVLPQASGDFLFFGVKPSSEDAPDKLPSRTRIYVTPKIWAAGKVAAQIIEKARLQGFEPHGKVLDESTSQAVRQRKDRLLFWVDTQGQLDIVLNALRELQSESPELFEPDPPLLTAKTDIPGVGLGESTFSGLSYNEVREKILETAWTKTLEKLTGHSSLEPRVMLEDSWHLDGRLFAVRRALEEGYIPLEDIVKTFREEVRAVAPAYEVAPDNFSKNIRSDQ